MPELTPCYGLPLLFESTDPLDHEAAKRLCATCVKATACLTDAEWQRRSPKYHPIGTWGGRLYLDKGPTT